MTENKPQVLVDNQEGNQGDGTRQARMTGSVYTRLWMWMRLWWLPRKSLL